MTTSTPVKEVGMRLMYWYGVTPVVVLVGTLVFLTIPYLALAVLAIVLFLGWRRSCGQSWYCRTGFGGAISPALASAK
jgi:hypothetical protein